MAVALEYQDDSLNGPYFPPVAQLARELVARSIDGLDPSVLRQRFLQNKIEEVFCLSFLDPRICTSEPSELTPPIIELAA